MSKPSAFLPLFDEPVTQPIGRLPASILSNFDVLEIVRRLNETGLGRFAG